jgi:hypothetical protein
MSEGMKGIDIYQQSAAQVWIETVCHNEVCARGSECSKAAEPVLLMQMVRDAYPHPQGNKTLRMLKQ